QLSRWLLVQRYRHLRIRERRLVPIVEYRYSRDGRGDLREELQAFAVQASAGAGQPRDVPARPGEALHEPKVHQVRAAAEIDDRNRAGRRHGGGDLQRATGGDDVHRQRNELGGEVGQPVRAALGIARLDKQVLAFYVAELAQALAQRQRKLLS